MEEVEILSRLPAKSICMFKTVCKSWNALFSEEYFLKKQSLNMKDVEEDHGFFIQPRHHELQAHALEAHSFRKYPGSGINFPPEALDFLSKKGQILASSNGLVCCKKINICNDAQPWLFVCSLANQTWCLVSTPNGFSNPARTDIKCILETKNYDEYTMMLFKVDTSEEWDVDYKLVSKVYSCDQGGWEDGGIVNLGGRSYSVEHDPVSHNGFVFFLSDSFPSTTSRTNPSYWPYITAYDVINGLSRRIDIPKDARKWVFHPSGKLGLFKYGTSIAAKSLCLVNVKKSVCYVWILKKHSSCYEYYSWNRVLKKQLKSMGVRGSVAGFSISGKWLLVATSRQVYRYDLESDQSVGSVEEVCSHKCGANVTFHFYSTTFHKCGNGESSIAAERLPT